MSDHWLTEAERTVLSDAHERHCVMIDGAFSGKTGSAGMAARDLHKMERGGVFHTRRIVTQLVARKFLTLGTGFNEYVLTELGDEVLHASNLPKKRPKRIPRVRPMQLDMFRQAERATAGVLS